MTIRVENVPLLVRTPSPFHYESLFGFLLRVSESNGYKSPWEVASLAKISMQQSKSRALPVGKLTQVLGLDSADLNRYSYIPVAGNASSRFKLLDHDLGSKYVDYQIRRSCRFCPLCVLEDGYIDAFWDLSIALACPRHSKDPLSHCHKCNREVDWHRPGLLRCKCGTNLLDAPLRDADEALVELMQIIYAKVHDISILNGVSEPAHPLAILEKFPLSQLLPMFYKLGSLSNGRPEIYPNLDAGYATRAIETVCEIFTQWPNGFYKFMHLKRKYSHLSNKDFWTEFKDFYKELMSSSWLDRRCSHLLKEFIRFGIDQWPSCAEVIVKAIPLSITLEKRPPVWKLNPYGVEDEEIQKAIKLKRIHTEKGAAKYLGLPLNVWSLVSQSHILTKFVIFGATKTLDYPWYQVELEEILHEACVVSANGEKNWFLPIKDLVSLRDVMSMEMASTEIKASFVADVILRKFSVHGWRGGNMANLLFERRAVTKYIVARRPGYELTCSSLPEAATRLIISKELVQALIHLGLLSFFIRGDLQYVIAHSLELFEAKFIAPEALSRKLKLSLGELQKVLEILQVPTLQFPADGDNPIGEIIDRHFESKIEAYLNNSNNALNNIPLSLPPEKLPKDQVGQYPKRVTQPNLKHAPQTWATL